jgi:ferrochelatase
MKTAVVLLNLGGPDSKESIKPFLRNFFTDPNIIRLPYPLRRIIAELIAWKRSKGEAADSYAELGNKSPLLENTAAQAEALKQLLLNDNKGEFETFVCMRYWHPMAEEVARKVKDYDPDHIVLLPLYPQYSTTTTRSSFQVWQNAAKKAGLEKPFHLICCYPEESGFVQASAALVRGMYHKAFMETGIRPRILFSAHGLPERIVKDGDPYQWQCIRTAENVARLTGIENPDWQICYQSRVGPQKWLGPSTEKALEKAAADHVPVVILPHAFTQEHVETLVEIEIEYREVAEHLGVPGFYRVPTVGTHPDFIRGLADMVLSAQNRQKISSNENRRICPAQFCNCAMQELSCAEKDC